MCHTRACRSLPEDRKPITPTPRRRVGFTERGVFPEPGPWPDAVDGAELLDGIATAIRSHVVLAEYARDIAALWVVHAYLTDCFLVSPRLCARSATKGCGKTTLLDVLSRLLPRPLPTANVTPAALFRVVEGYQPTLLVDEADTFLHDNNELRGVLNSGHRKGGTVLRTVGDDHEPRAFKTFCPTVIALIGTLPDTLHDRAVTIDLKRKLATETVAPFRPDRADHLDLLARKAVRWAQDNAEAIATVDPKMPHGIINREADNWRPLLAIADAAGGGWPERARKAAEAAHIAAGGDEASRLELLLADIQDAFATNKTTKAPNMFGGEQIEITSATLVKALVALDGRPWAEMGRDRKPMTQNRLARMLKPLGIGPQKVGPEDARVSGYVREHFKEAFERYLPSEGVSQVDSRTERDEMGTSDISKVDSLEPGCPVMKSQKSNNDGVVSGCPVWKGDAQTATPMPCAFCGQTGTPDAPVYQTNHLHRGDPLNSPPGGMPTVPLHERCVQPFFANGKGEPAHGTVASVPFMITRAVKEQLYARGWTEEDVRTLTPQQVHEILEDSF